MSLSRELGKDVTPASQESVEVGSDTLEVIVNRVPQWGKQVGNR